MSEKEIQKPSRFQILKAISDALDEGKIEKGNARSMRAELGITQADFTRTQPTKAKSKSKRKAQRKARRNNR